MLIIDNSDGSFAKKYGTQYMNFQENIGISRSWNIGVERVLEDKLDYLIILSATMVFDEGMNDFIELLEKNENPYGMTTNFNWHLIALSRKTFETVGDFDTNFYPAYYEDADYIRRMELAGIHNTVGQPRLPKVEVACKSQGDAHGIKTTNIKVNMGAMTDYFISKWGKDAHYTQDVRDGMYKHPYNNPKYPLDFYPKRTIDQLKRRYMI
jgi:GT2 family glycosyltransferase